MENLKKNIQFLKGVGPEKKKLLSKLGIETVFDCLWHIPRDYEDYNSITRIADLKPDENVLLKCSIKSIKKYRTSRGINIVKALLEDASGVITGVWFNQGFLAETLKIGQDILIKGKVKINYSHIEINVSGYESLNNQPFNSLGMIPIYRLVEGLNQKLMRRLMRLILDNYLDEYPEIFSSEFLQSNSFCDIKFAWYNIHFPQNNEAYQKARKRLALEEIFLFQARIPPRKLHKSSWPTSSYDLAGSHLFSEIIRKLPFRLTNAQNRVVQQIYADMDSVQPMQRLLQGDVGSGKTVVAALAMARAIEKGHQAALMAPTEVLVQQHYEAISKIMPEDIVMAQLTSSIPVKEKRLIIDAVKNGEIDMLLGTQALLNEDLSFKELKLIVIDEQQRFGVRQRAILEKKGKNPDILVMTATPIPRTLALAIYGGLDLSIINELPPGRKEVKTRYINRKYRFQGYEFIKKQVLSGAQAYIVCPLVEESEHQDLQDVISLFNELQEWFAPDIQVGVLHGRLSNEQKSWVMERFKQRDIQVLIATTVIEVGIDVPEATVMQVEHAERFGLSQLHQLRGRVGRGSRQSYCILAADPPNEIALKRLKAMEKSSDGFELANIDLALRGPGDFWGIKQHGLDDFKVLDLIKDNEIIEKSIFLIKKSKYAYLTSPLLRNYIDLRFKPDIPIAGN